MRLRRKGTDTPEPTDTAETPDEDAAGEPDTAGEAAERDGGPFDIDEVPEDDDIGRVDLGSVLFVPLDECQLQVQVDEPSGEVRAVLLATEEGALELRAFAAARHGDLWGEARPEIAADIERRGGIAEERDGRFGPELVCQVPMTRPDGTTGVQFQRVVGVNGPRWMLRAMFLGEPARDAATAARWDEVVASTVVRRGAQAMPVGEQLPLRLPEGANPRPLDQG